MLRHPSENRNQSPRETSKPSKPMTLFRRPVLAALILAAPAVFGQSPGSEAYIPAQAAADVVREVAGADGAFLPAGMLKSSFQRDDLATLVQFPDDEIVIVSLKGSEIRQAFERSVSLYPQSNSSFLQVSGFEIAFDGNATPGQRIKSVGTAGGRLDEQREYQIAMPSSLGRGGYGYFKLWDRAKIAKTLETTLGKALAGKRVSESRPRWVVQP